MATKHRYVNTHFWDDSFIVNLDPIEKLLFLYFLTNPLASIAGAYEISIRRVAFDTGIDKDMILKILTRFETADKMIYKDGWILITNFIKNQALNPNIKKGIDESVSRCPDWIKERLYKGLESLSKPSKYLNLNLNSNSNSTEEKEASVPAVAEETETEELESETTVFLTRIKTAYDTSVLTNETRWLEVVSKAIADKIPIENFIAALNKLLLDKTRKYPVTPENVLSEAIEQRARRNRSPETPKRKTAREYHAEIEGLKP